MSRLSWVPNFFFKMSLFLQNVDIYVESEKEYTHALTLAKDSYGIIGEIWFGMVNT